MRHAIYIVLSIFFGVMFWFAFDAEHAPHEPFTFDYRTFLGLTAWLCAVASAKCGSLAFSSKEL